MPVYVQGTEFKPDRINLPQSASDPAGSHELGDIYFNTTDKELKIYQNVDTVGMAFTTMYSGSSQSYTFNDVAYSNFFTNNDSPINCSTSNVQTWNAPGSSGNSGACHDTLDCFFDNSQGRIYGAYNTCHYWPWNNGGGTYSGSANWYQINGARTNLNGHSSSSMGSDGRGVTIAYLQDDTPVIVIGNSSDYRFYYFDYPNGTYLGSQDCNSGGSNDPNNAYWSGICFNGSHMLVTTRGNTNDRFVYAYEMPANTSSIGGSNISTVAKWSISHVCHYGMVWGGGNRVYVTNKDSTETVTQFQLSGTGISDGHSGTSTSVATYTLDGTTNYSLGMDYKNRKLIIGGYSNNKYRVYGE